MTKEEYEALLKEETRKAKARYSVKVTARTDDILPRRVYELAGAPVPDEATDEYQARTDWWQWQQDNRPKPSFIDRMLAKIGL